MTITTMEAAQMAALSEEEQHTLERCEVAIQAGKEAFLRVGTALLTIRDRRLYRATHSNFEDYLREKWDMGKSHGYRLIEAAEVVAGLSPVGDVLPANEAQARSLAQLPAEERQEAWQGAVEAAQSAAVTAAHVQREVDERLGKGPRSAGPISEQELNDAVYLAVLNTHNSHARWAAYRQSGIDDKDLRLRLGEEFGLSGGIHRRGHPDIRFQGGKDPSLAIGEGKDVVGLRGRSLLDRVRAVLSLPQPDKPSPALKQSREADNDGAQASKAEDHPGMEVRADEHAAAAPAKREAEAEEPAQEPLDGNDWHVRLMADVLVMQEVLRGWLPEQHGGRKRQAPYAILEEILERCGWVLKSLRSSLEIYGVTINDEAQIRDQHSAVARRIQDLERQSVEKDDVIAALSLELEQQHEVAQPGAGWVIPEDAEELLIALAQRKRPGQTEDVSPAQYLVTLIQQRAEQAGLAFEDGKVVQR